jgi:Common central domain of tyrosinase
VKRELRSLTVQDREIFLEAVAELWWNDDNTGKQKYGPRFTSVSTFTEQHSLASGDIMCDQFHEGSAFITHHLALQNAFELSLRSVNPAVTLPYWDFTIEGEIIKNLNQTPSYMLNVSDFFSDVWFGSVDKNHHIIDSRFAHSLIPKSESGVRNSYGYVRSYWNNNPDKEVTRSLFSTCGLEPLNKRIPTCQDHFDLVNTSTLGEFQLLSPARGHGPMHVHSGGMWGGCTEAYKEFSDKWSDVLDADMTEHEVKSYDFSGEWEWGYESPRRQIIEYMVMGEYFHIYRALWRSHMCSASQLPALLECPKSCDDNAPLDECKCDVKALVNGTIDWTEIYPCVISSSYALELFQKLMPTELVKDLVTMIATVPVAEGDMLESASPADILFWVIHPTIERLLQAKRLYTVSQIGNTSFTKWSKPQQETWLQYSFYDLKEGENAFHPGNYTCRGHAAGDPALASVLQMTDIIYTNDLDGDGVLTNLEFYEALDPNEMNNNDYVFDNFDWDHCNE